VTCCAVSAVAFSTASLGTSVRRDGALKVLFILALAAQLPF